MLEDAEDEWIDEAELSSTGYAELEQHREVRELMRVAAWEMPLLSRLAKPFKPPKIATSPLRWRYTTYFGDPHPASRKVVVEFRVSDLRLEPEAASKLKKLAGVRYNPGTNSVRMSSDSFDTQARNKRFLATTIEKLIHEANDKSTDSFGDIALDRRHFKPKPQYTFPDHWKMTEERRAQMEAKRLGFALYNARRIEENPDISGLSAIEEEFEQHSQSVAEPQMIAKGREMKKGP
jgi:small subunit ribosomal protein S35